MEKCPFYIVDVFAEEKYAGNQLAVIRKAKGISDKEMQQIAKEMNYSETTFILDDNEINGGYDVRIFTPEAEVPFAGHPTLGTAWIIQNQIIQENVDSLKLNLKVGQIPVTFNYEGEQKDVLWMKQIEPTFGEVLSPQALARVLGIDLNAIDERFPIQAVSTGLPFIIVPLKTLSAVKACRVDIKELLELVKDMEAKAIMVFCPDTYGDANQLNARVFVDCYGIPEDPATGSANGCLAGYLAHYHYFGDSKINVRVEQGYEIGRPSLLYLQAEEKEGKIDIYVGGKVILVAQGELV